MLRKLALLLAACVLCQCKADDARAPASESPQGAPAAPAAEPAPTPIQSQQPAAPPSDEAESELPDSTGAAAPRKGQPVLPSPGKDSKTRGLDGLDPNPTAGKPFASLSEAEAALSSAEQQLERLYVVSGKASQLAEGDDRCVRACGAFSSLERAAAGVCRLAGDSDPRCAKARSRVHHHKSKVAACSCSGD